MKGVILAGGTGSRLFPCTKVTNKHLLPVFNKPMIHYPVETLQKSGIREILVVSSPEHVGDFMTLLGSGIDFDVDFTYKIQDGSGGIAQALSLAEDFASGEPIAMILSDNIFEDDFSEEIFYFKAGAQIFVKKVEDPERFGVVEIRDDGTVRSIEEKPSFPKSNFAQTGFAIYDSQVFDFIRQIKPSKRGELEITDLNNIYLEKNELKASKTPGMWIDAGTHESLLEASILAQEAFDPSRQKVVRKSATPRANVENYSPRVSVGLLTHNSEKYIDTCIQSLLSQDYENIDITVLDNNSNDDTLKKLAAFGSDITVLKNEENKGFGAGHNKLIRECEGDFYACVNIDMVFEPNFISELVKTISEKPVYGSSGGKIKRWDFEGFCKNAGGVGDMGKTNFIDSVGIKLLASHRFQDLGQGEVDYGQYDHERDVFGASGAAVLYRKKALDDIAYENTKGQKEYFDESMFMYKEDVDLAYRLQWAGWKCRFCPEAISFHDRTTKSIGHKTIEIIRNRNQKSKQVNRLSYLNHQIVLEKNFSSDFSRKIRGATAWYNFKVFFYLLFFETETLGQWWKYFTMRKDIQAKKNNMPRRISAQEMEEMVRS